MFRRITIAVALAFGLSGCITVYEYGAEADSDDRYYSEPSIDRYDYGYGPYYDRYYDPYYDRYGYRRYGSWSGSIGYRFGNGGLGRYGDPYWYFGYGYGYGYGDPYYSPFWPDRYYGHGGYHHRPPTNRPPTNRPPTTRPGVHPRPPQYPAQIERRPVQADERDPPWRRLQDLGRPVPDIISEPQPMTGAMPRPVPRRPDSNPIQSPSAPVIVAGPSPVQRMPEPRQERPPMPDPMPMPSRRFEQDQDSPGFQPMPAPAPHRTPESQERETRPEPR